MESSTNKNDQNLCNKHQIKQALCTYENCKAGINSDTQSISDVLVSFHTQCVRNKTSEN